MEVTIQNTPWTRSTCQFLCNILQIYPKYNYIELQRNQKTGYQKLEYKRLKSQHPNFERKTNLNALDF